MHHGNIGTIGFQFLIDLISNPNMTFIIAVAKETPNATVKAIMSILFLCRNNVPLTILQNILLTHRKAIFSCSKTALSIIIFYLQSRIQREQDYNHLWSRLWICSWQHHNVCIPHHHFSHNIPQLHKYHRHPVQLHNYLPSVFHDNKPHIVSTACLIGKSMQMPVFHITKRNNNLLPSSW